MAFEQGEEGDFLPPGDVAGQVPGFADLGKPWGQVADPPGGTSSVEGKIAVEEPQLPVPEFEPSLREDWAKLTQLGYLQSKPLEFLGHTFVLRTLDIDTILAVGLLHAEFVGTIADLKAYTTLLSAAAVVSVDRKALAVPLGSEDRDLQGRFDVVKRWFPPTLDFVYEEYLKLEAQVDRIIAAMQEGHSLGGATGSVDSTPGLSPASA